MYRLEVINKIAVKNKARTYLEIGVRYGTVFLRVKADRKIAVDPKLRISVFNKVLFLKDFRKNQYFHKTSNDFFREDRSIFEKEKINLAFIDGLHTYEQSLEDVLNCLENLDDNGVIVMHDCNPTTEAMASASYEEFLLRNERGKAWCGDVWKTILHLRSLREDLNVFVLDTDYGLGIVTKGKPGSMLSYTMDDIRDMSYKDLAANRQEILNLKDVGYLAQFISTLHG